jgi:hypothetical protein
MELSSILVLLESCLQTCMTYTIAECTVNNLLLMDRGTARNSQNKFLKLVHLFGFIKKKSHCWCYTLYHRLVEACFTLITTLYVMAKDLTQCYGIGGYDAMYFGRYISMFRLEVPSLYSMNETPIGKTNIITCYKTLIVKLTAV